MNDKKFVEKQENKTVWTQFRHVDEIITEAGGQVEKSRRCETEAEEILKAEDKEHGILDEQNSNYVRDTFDWRR